MNTKQLTTVLSFACLSALPSLVSGQVTQEGLIDLEDSVFASLVFNDDVQAAADLIIEAGQSVGISVSNAQALEGVGIVDDYLTGDITLAEYEALINDWVVGVISGASTDEGASPGTTVLKTSETVLRKQLFAPAKTEQEKEAEALASSSAKGISFSSDIYYNETEFLNAVEMETYGANLSATFGDEYEFTVTVPISRTEIGQVDYTTYGLDFATLVEVNENIKVGGHANYLETSGDVDRHSFTVGPVGSARFDISEDVILSFGALVDRIEVEDRDEEWIGAFGANFGYAINENFAINPYVILYKNFDADNGVDDSWYDIGLEGSVALGGAWGVTAGFKITEGYDPIDESWEIYVGSGFQF